MARVYFDSLSIIMYANENAPLFLPFLGRILLAYKRVLHEQISKHLAFTKFNFKE
jgi:hypothetical protein